MLIRRARLNDIDAVASLWLEMMLEHESRDRRFEMDAQSSGEYSRQLEEMMSNSDIAVFVAEQADEILGYILVMVLMNPPYFRVKRYGFVAELSVARTHRRTGAGGELWARAVRWFKRKEIEVVQLNVSPENTAGMAFWNSVGFEDFLVIKWHHLNEGQQK